MKETLRVGFGMALERTKRWALEGEGREAQEGGLEQDFCKPRRAMVGCFFLLPCDSPASLHKL